MRFIVNSLLVATLAMVIYGCCPKDGGSGKQTVSLKVDKKGEVLANIGTDVITKEEFEKELNRQSPFIRARYSSPEQRKNFLNNMIKFEVLAQESIRRGFHENPDVIKSMKKMMVQKMIQNDFESKIKRDDITAEELKKYYSEHLIDYNKPEMARVSHIKFAFGSNKQASLKKARGLLKDLNAKKNDRLYFSQMARKNSDDAQTKSKGGDLNYLSKEDMEKKLGGKFTTSAFNLKKVGDLSGLVETDKSYHIVKLTGLRKKIERSFEQVEGQIRNKLYRENRTKAYDDFVSSLKNKTNIAIKDDILTKVQIKGSGFANKKGSGKQDVPKLKPVKPEIKPKLKPVPANTKLPKDNKKKD